MLIIAIDTSGRNGSVALCRGDEHSFETLQVTPLEGGTYSARLVPAIAEMIGNQGFSKNQVDVFVVISGPGSFTGLRVGIATVKGLCEVLQKPLVAVSMLEAVAVLRGDGPEKIAVVLDAGRGEAYVGEFSIADGRAKTLREYIAKLEIFSAEARENGLATLTPDGKVFEVLKATGAPVQQVEPLRADDIGRFGLAKFLAGELADPATLDANYIRRSDAEIFSPRK